MSKAWIFDFDGTLVDSKPAITSCYEETTKKIAPNRINKLINLAIGPTLEETTNQILGPTLTNLNENFIACFQEQYDHQKIFETKFYLGTDHLLKELKDRGDSVAIATNKRTGPTKSLVKLYGWQDYFEWIACLEDYQNDCKNKSEMVYQLIKQYPNFSKAYFIGDTVNDGISANQNNLFFIKADYGYGKKEDWAEIKIHKNISSITEILEI